MTVSSLGPPPRKQAIPAACTGWSVRNGFALKVQSVDESAEALYSRVAIAVRVVHYLAINNRLVGRRS
jgi:hypothetical protein